jgi:DNA polymerase III subunit epsilon
MRQIVLDTETTGLSAAQGDRIIEIGCVELLNRKLTGNNLHFYINPERDSHEDALKVHGITTEFLRDKPKFAAIASELGAYLQGAELIIHNAPFDLSFLNKEMSLLGLPPITQVAESVIDTLVMAKEMFPGKRNGLDALCSRLDVDNSNRTLHGALLDAELLADVYINMTRGQNALAMEEEDAVVVMQYPEEEVDFSAFDLPVIRANEHELQSHESVLADLDKAVNGQAFFRKIPA